MTWLLSKPSALAIWLRVMPGAWVPLVDVDGLVEVDRFGGRKADVLYDDAVRCGRGRLLSRGGATAHERNSCEE